MVNLPFRYAGGKFYALKLLRPFWEAILHDEYREPFVGGGSVFFEKPKSLHNWIKDIDSELINTYRIMANPVQRKKLINLVSNEIAAPERHKEVCEFEPKTELERAFKYFYLNRTSFSGKMRNPCRGYRPVRSLPPERWHERINPCGSKLEVRYYIKPAFRNEGARIQNIGIINNFSGQQIRECIHQEARIKAVCYGFSENLYKSLNESELNKFQEWMGEIQSIHADLLRLRQDKIHEIWEGEINDFINKAENFNIRKMLDSEDLVEEFGRNLLDKIMISVVFSHMLNQSPEENIADSVYDFFTDEDAEQYGLKHSDIEKVEKFVDDNLDFFMQDAYPSNVAISSFAARDFPPLEKFDSEP